MKYIILELEGGEKMPVIFPVKFKNYDVADALIHYLSMRGVPICGGVYSAGECSIDDLQMLTLQDDSLPEQCVSMPGDDLEIMSHDHFSLVRSVRKMEAAPEDKPMTIEQAVALCERYNAEHPQKVGKYDA